MVSLKADHAHRKRGVSGFGTIIPGPVVLAITPQLIAELRISAGFVCDAQSCFSKILIEVTRRTLAAFLRTRFSEELLRKNRIAALDFTYAYR
jgi:hypothetical protein